MINIYHWLVTGELPTLGRFSLLLLFSLGLRWFVFDYHGTRWLKDALTNSGVSLLQTLAFCLYCQTVETSTVVYLLLAGDCSPIAIALAILANGMIAINIVPVLSFFILEWEAQQEHNDDEFDVDEAGVKE